MHNFTFALRIFKIMWYMSHNMPNMAYIRRIGGETPVFMYKYAHICTYLCIYMYIHVHIYGYVWLIDHTYLYTNIKHAHTCICASMMYTYIIHNTSYVLYIHTIYVCTIMIHRMYHLYITYLLCYKIDVLHTSTCDNIWSYMCIHMIIQIIHTSTYTASTCWWVLRVWWCV